MSVRSRARARGEKNWRGYTLIEVIVSVTLGMVVIGLVMRWGLGITVVASDALRSETQGDLALVADRFSADATGALPCGHLASVVRKIGPDEVWFTADVEGDGIIEQVGWKINDGTAWRAVDPLVSCTAPGELSWVPVAYGVDGQIAPVVEGDIVSGPSWEGVCSAPLEQRCRVKSVSMTLSREDVGGWYTETARLGP